MIVFDLGCANGHVFEAWFGSTQDYDDQRARGLVTCPLCNSAEVDKAVMAPRLARKGNQQLPVPAHSNTAMPVANEQIMPEQVKAALSALAEAQAEALKSAEWVGPRFADEARSMHLGELEHRPIYGQTTPDEAKGLIEDGIPVAPLPFPIRPPGTDN